MLINETTINCCKPKRNITFKAQDSKYSTKKVRYKHYEQMSDEVLGVRSILKAHKDVEESNKMRLFKALPSITTGLLGLCIAIAQPGKLAAKAGAGLGFLALTEGIAAGVEAVGDSLYKKAENRKNNTPIKTALKIAGGVVALGVAAAVGIAAKKTGAFKKVSTFVASEGRQLAKEINETKLASFIDEKITPFAKKHSKSVGAAEVLGTAGVIIGSTSAQLKLADSLSKDIKEKATQNYAKGKAIQAIARAHFDSIDAQEV